MFSLLSCNRTYLQPIKREYTDANCILPSWQDNMNKAVSVQHSINVIIYNQLEIDNANEILNSESKINCLNIAENEIVCQN